MVFILLDLSVVTVSILRSCPWDNSRMFYVKILKLELTCAKSNSTSLAANGSIIPDDVAYMNRVLDTE